MPFMAIIFSSSSNYNGLYYNVAHTRFPPWLIGIIFGSFMIDYKASKNQYRTSQVNNYFHTIIMHYRIFIFQIIHWIVSIITLAIMCFIIIYQRNINNNSTLLLKSSLFIALHRPIWGLCIAWISYSCFTGNAYYIDTLLSMPFFQILSKIIYSTYLVHLTVIILNMQSSRILPYFSEYEFVSNILLSIF